MTKDEKAFAGLIAIAVFVASRMNGGTVTPERACDDAERLIKEIKSRDWPVGPQ